MNFEKLNQDLEKASVERADAELDRMIKMHEEAAKVAKEKVKRYLQSVAVDPKVTPNFQANNQDMTDWVWNDMRAKYLRDLKKELE